MVKSMEEGVEEVKASEETSVDSIEIDDEIALNSEEITALIGSYHKKKKNVSYGIDIALIKSGVSFNHSRQNIKKS